MARSFRRLEYFPPDLRRVLLIGALSAGAYLLLYLAQRALFLNGLLHAGDGSAAAIPGVTLQGTQRDASQVPRQLAAYYGGTIALFVLYGWLLHLCRQLSWGTTARRIALALPAAFYLGLLFAPPTLSRDVYTYAANGYLSAALHGNPYLQPPSMVVDTPLGHQLLSAGWLVWREVTPYGPLWTLAQSLVLHLTTNLTLAVLFLKTIVVAASLGSAAIIWRILGKVAPESQLLGTVAYLWNPLIILEIAGDGHNDALMVLCVLAALLAAVHFRPAGSVLGLAMGALVKYLPLLFLPAILVYFFNRQRERQQLLARAALGVLAGVLIAAVVVALFWSGGTTPYQTIPEGGQRGVTASLSGALIWGLSRLLPQSAAAWLVALLLNGIAAAYVLVKSRGVSESTQLLSVCASTAVFYLLVASPLVWPWYAALPVALLALSPRGRLAPMLIILPLCLRLVAPLTVLYENHFITWPVSAVATILASTSALLAFLYLQFPSLRARGREVSTRLLPSRRPAPVGIGPVAIRARKSAWKQR